VVELVDSTLQPANQIQVNEVDDQSNPEGNLGDRFTDLGNCVFGLFNGVFCLVSILCHICAFNGLVDGLGDVKLRCKQEEAYGEYVKNREEDEHIEDAFDACSSPADFVLYSLLAILLKGSVPKACISGLLFVIDTTVMVVPSL
jgi:hypothetical protein